ncbi:hypothetical protein LXL04_027381 [Taraxacum kok-saghyz]
MFYTRAWVSWGGVDKASRQCMYDRFKNLYQWLDSEANIYNSFLYILKNNFRELLRTARRKAAAAAKAAGHVFLEKFHMSMRDYPPGWIRQEIWHELCDRRKSESASINRSSMVDGCMSKHTGGSISMEQHRIKLAEENGKQPQWDTVYMVTHLTASSKKRLLSGEESSGSEPSEHLDFITSRAGNQRILSQVRPFSLLSFSESYDFNFQGTSIHCTRERRSLIPNRQSPIANRQSPGTRTGTETGTTGYCDSSLGLSFNFKSGTSPCLSLSPSFSFNFKSQLQISTPHQMQEIGKAEEEIERCMLWKRARQRKKGGYDPNVQIIVDKFDELQKAENFGDVVTGTDDVLTRALGTEEHRGAVRGMGKYVTPHHDVKTLRDHVNSVSEGASCVNNVKDDFEDGPFEDSPVSCMCTPYFGENLEDHAQVNDVLVEMGTYFQMQIGTNIKDFKCLTKEMKNKKNNFTRENYGRKYPVGVAKVKELYHTLNLQELYRKAMIEKYGDDLTQHPIGDDELWKQCAGGSKKGRMKDLQARLDESEARQQCDREESEARHQEELAKIRKEHEESEARQEKRMQEIWRKLDQSSGGNN